MNAAKVALVALRYAPQLIRWGRRVVERAHASPRDTGVAIDAMMAEMIEGFQANDELFKESFGQRPKTYYPPRPVPDKKE